jgi:predicted dehydrogenase
MNKIKCAVIGVGYLGKFHADKYASLENVDLVAVCDSDKERSESIAKIHGISATTDYRDLLGKVDAVSIAAITSTHYQIAKDFLQNGTHVLVEKPITTTVAEAEELINIASQKKAILQVGHLERLNPVILSLTNSLQKPLFIESVRLAPYKPRATDVNVILDLMIHDIDLIQFLVNSPIENISATGAPVISKDIDIANARIEFANGCTATAVASRVSIEPKRKLRIFARDAYFSGDLHNKTLRISRKGANEMFPGIPEIVREDFSLPNNDPLLEEIKAFVDSIVKGKPPIISGEDGLKALQTAIKITDIVTKNFKKATA